MKKYILEDINNNRYVERKKFKFKVNDYVVFKNIPFKEGKIIKIDGSNYLIQDIKVKIHRDNSYSIKEKWNKKWYNESELDLL